MSYVGKVSSGGNAALIGTTLYGVCSTPQSTAAKTVTIDGLDTLFVGLTIHVKFSNSNTAANPTLEISGSGAGAIRIKRYGQTDAGDEVATSWQAGSILSLTYDGENWIITGWLNTDTNTTYEDATTSVHGLMSTADKAKMDNLNVLTFTNVPVDEEDWVTEVEPTYPGYAYKAVIALTGVLAAHVPSVIFSPEQISIYSPAPVAETGNGTVTVYFQSKPAADITIPTIQLVKGEVGT